jgi:hypothetical protein
MLKDTPNSVNKSVLLTDDAVRLLVTKIIRDCPKKREAIAEELSKLLDLTVTVHMINDWTKHAKKKARFPLAFIEAFSLVTGDERLRELAAGRGIVTAARAFFAREEALKTNKKGSRKR